MISLYSASKFAVEGFSEALSFELLALGIVVEIVEPHGGVNATKFNERTNEASSRHEQSCQTRNTSTSCAATSAMPLASHELAMAPSPSLRRTWPVNSNAGRV
jgi:short-subunit dehydrogenase